MSAIYEVYRHPSKGEWGVHIGANAALIATVAEGNVKTQSVGVHKVASEISAKLRMGYTKLSRARYLLDMEEPGKSAFVERHPDLLRLPNILMFATLSLEDDVFAIVKMLDDTMEVAQAPLSEITDWAEAARKCKSYLPVDDSSASVALVVANWAISNGRTLCASHEGVPIETPQHNPFDWLSWLQKAGIPAADIRKAQAGLGWTIKDAYARSTPGLAVQDTNVAASAGGWLEAAAQAAF